MLNSHFKLLIAAIIFCSLVAPAVAGTILLMGIGLGTPGSAPPPSCSNSLDFSDGCNSQYVPVL